jgi:PTS system galactitol-specific IIA component
LQYRLTDLINENHIILNLVAKDAIEVIDQLTIPLVKTGHVTSEFAEDVWKRELKFPTGLPTEPLAVAIPHADPDHVNQSSVCLGVLSSPVGFGQMGTDGSKKLPIKLVFLLAINEKEKQVEVISQLIQLIQAGTLLENLAKAENASDCVNLIHETLTD